MIARTCFLIATGLSLLIDPRSLRAQDGAPARPRILGLAQVAFYVHDIEVSRKYYRDFLGYEEAYTLKKPDGSLRAALFKIGDRQTIELVPEIAPATDRLAHITLETDDAEALRVYLKSRGIAVPDQTTQGQVTSAYFTVVDPDGHTVEFAQYSPGSWTIRDAGLHLPATRISEHMSHAGIAVRHLDAALKFYRDVLGGTIVRKGSGNGKVLSWVNVQVANGTDWVEFMLYDEKQPQTLAKLGVNHHFCLVVPDAAVAAKILQARPLPPGARLLPVVSVGTDHKRKIQGYDPDGSRIEFMEPTTIDGLPAPWSSAPPPNS
jgi:catechol 2,3-dioxygenase-like lactoylglutathione lyase family enzyme